jgi:hypothetical protein
MQVKKKSAHPDRQLFDYLSGALDADSRVSVEEHLSACGDCARVADLVRTLKTGASPLSRRQSRISNLESQVSEEHLPVSELASFFYSKSPRASNKTAAAHVAQCRSCAEAIAEYARAERAAREYDPAQAAGGEVPAKAWEMIREWEESSFAKPKPASETLGQEMLAKLFNLLSEQKDWLRNARRSVTGQAAGQDEPRNLVPVIVVDKSGQFRGVEMFEKVTDADGESVLKHAEKSERFDKKPVHALLDFGEKDRVLVTDRINHDTVRIRQASGPNARLRHADYFIIED